MVASSNREFNEWARRWMELATFSGRLVPDEEARIAAVAALWREEIPPGWERGQDSRLLDREQRYCRRKDSIRRGEYVIEGEVLDPDPGKVSTICLGARLVDGVNAVPLAKDSGGGRTGNVEADMLLLVRDEHEYRLLLVEVKTGSNHAWFAAVENLRQLKLFKQSPETQLLFRRRCPEMDLPERLPVTAVVLAPPRFYVANGRRAESVAPAERLLERMRDEADADVRLATWELRDRTIVPLKPA